LKYYIYSIIAAFWLLSCAAEPNPPYWEVGKGFYLGIDGKMYILTQSVWIDGAQDEDYSWTGKSRKSEYEKPFFRIVPFVDVPTYRDLEQGYYAKDTNNVYIWYYTSDGNHLGLFHEADAATFRLLGGRWARDSTKVFYDGIWLEKLNADDMQILDADTTDAAYPFSVVKDKKYVYHDLELIADADAPTFECVVTDSNKYFRDKNWIYTQDFLNNPHSEAKKPR
jgi:hypothetical protein